MRKKKTMKDDKEYVEAVQEMKLRKDLLSEALFALQKLQAQEKKASVISAAHDDIKQAYDLLEEVLDSVERTMARVEVLGEKTEDEYQDAIIDILLEACGFSEKEIKFLKNF